MFTFLAADLITGKLREQLPLQIESDLSRYLMDVGTGTLSLSVSDPACPREWEDLTLPWRSLIVVVDDDTGRILWGGIPTNRTRNPVDAGVKLPCVTVEGYFSKRYVPTLSFLQQDQTSSIARRIAGICNEDNGINLELDTPATGVLRDRDYYNDESGRVLDRLQELGQVINGFEWSVSIGWSDDAQTAFSKVFHTGYPVIGTITDKPTAVFEMPGGITTAQYDEFWGEDQAATHVYAVGDGEGESRLISTPVTDSVRENAGWPRLEVRRSFSSVRDHFTIDAHARSVADETFGGQQLITLTARTDQPPTLDDWNLGDSVKIKIDTDSVHLDEVWRVVGWQLSSDVDTVQPSLARVRNTPSVEGSTD